ncbi:hypothetical protein PG988_001393 [Apiospora saccharicola]
MRFTNAGRCGASTPKGITTRRTTQSPPETRSSGLTGRLRVSTEALPRREQVEKHQAILDKLLDQEALILQRDAAVAAGATVEVLQNMEKRKAEQNKAEVDALVMKKRQEAANKMQL